MPTRKVSVRLTTTYAGFEGESDLLETLYKRGLQGEEIAPSLFRQRGLLMFWSHEPVAPWQTAEWVEQMRRQLRPNAFLRMIENRFVTSESSFVQPEWWAACEDAEARPIVADRNLAVWVGVDASAKRDSTAIVACTWDESARKVRLVGYRVFQPSPSDPLDFEATVEETLLAVHQRFYLQQVHYDPYQLIAVAQRLQRASVPMVEFPQSVPNLTEASTNLYDLIKGRNLVVYPDEGLRRAIHQAVALETNRGWRIAKEKQAHKIDVVVALAQAALGAVKGGHSGPGRFVRDVPPQPRSATPRGAHAVSPLIAAGPRQREPKPPARRSVEGVTSPRAPSPCVFSVDAAFRTGGDSCDHRLDYEAHWVIRKKVPVASREENPMRASRCSLIPGLLLVLIVTFPFSSAGQVPVEVNTCGQVVSGYGFLAADLDCTGFTGGLLGYGAAIILSRRATLDLRGFTLRGGEYGLICAEPCGGASNALCSVPFCKIRGGGGTIAGAVHTGILSDGVVLDDVTVRDCDRGIDGYDGKVRLESSLVTGNAVGIRTSRYVLLINSTVTGNTQADVVATHGVRLRGSSTVGP